MSELENNVANKTFAELFNQSVQFEIPFFQRGYVWGRDQWKILFEDINEQVMPDIKSGETEADAEHFFGPIVMLERKNTGINLRKFLIIDGQQRITTIYLLLAIINRLIKEKSHDSQQAANYCYELNNYIKNKFEKTIDDDYNYLKVLSSKGDRLPTYQHVFNAGNPNTPLLGVDQDLYEPEKNNIDAFVKYAKKKLEKEYGNVTALWQLSQILLRSLKIVWIGLDEDKDDPQAIFESLNDKGTPLTATELICNYIFKPLMKSKSGDHERMHIDYWLQAQKNIDLAGNFEEYLRILFSVGEKKLIGKDRRVYVHFKNHHKNLSADEATAYLKEIKMDTDVYNQISVPAICQHKNEEIRKLLIDIKSVRAEVCNIFLFTLLRANKNDLLDDADTKSILREVLTLLVRRKACSLIVTKYDAIFPSMLKKILHESNKVKAFTDQIRKENYFVSDQAFQDALIDKPLYRKKDLPFTRMVLREIDRYMCNHGQTPDYSTLETVEHILPQNPDASWKIYIGEDSNDSDLHSYIDTLGNLCLLSGPANSVAGRNPFNEKVDGYPSPLSPLATELKEWKDDAGKERIWNIESIKERGERLSKIALKIWAWTD